MFFQCKCCPVHEARIQDLKTQIEDLKRFALPYNQVKPSLLEMEADAILSGHQDIISLNKEEESDDSDLFELSRERDRILSGNY